jgi:hypothetical protein
VGLGYVGGNAASERDNRVSHSVKAPTPSADTPPWGVALMRDLVAWVRTLGKQPTSLPSFTVAGLPDAADWYSAQSQLGHSAMIFVSNESGGAVPAFTDGTNWRRVTDRAVVS